MKYSASDNENIRVSAPEDCGNSPRNILLKEITIDLVTDKKKFLEDLIEEDIEWSVVGEEVIKGKEKLNERFSRMLKGTPAELSFHNIITHGKTGAVDATLIMQDGKKYAFCTVFNFTSAGKKSKIKKIKSYIIEITPA